MKLCALGFVVAVFLLCSQLQAACVSVANAPDHVGETRCVRGKVLRVRQGTQGNHYLNFCENYQSCPFTVVIFPSDLPHVGDVRELTGKVVEVHGPVQMYDGRAEIVLRDARQLSGEAAKIPRLPKNYDVENKGRYSAGKYSYSTTTRQAPRKRTQGKPIQTEDTSKDSEE